MTRTILAKFSDAVVKLCDSVDFVREKHSLFRPSHSLLIISSMCFSASPRGFSLLYNSLYDPSSPFCDSSCMRQRTKMLDHALFGQYWRGCWAAMLWTEWIYLKLLLVLILSSYVIKFLVCSDLCTAHVVPEPHDLCRAGDDPMNVFFVALC